MAVLLDGKSLSKKVKDDLKNQVDILKQNGIYPKLAVIMVGNDPASAVYVKNKSKACKYVGIEFEEYLLDEKIDEEELLSLIHINKR